MSTDIRTDETAQLTDGVMQLSTGPGLGWELDESFVERYRSDR